MKASDLELSGLLDASDGRILFGGARAVLLDAAALGLLRKELIESFGVKAARGILTRFGFAHGWRSAESLEHAHPWEDPSEWRRAGGRLHTLQGLVVVEGLPDQGQPGRPFAEALWHDSYEAEQHLLHVGQSEEPVCWSLIGFASGYLSRSNSAEIYCLETQCVARGDPVCRFAARTREDWGPQIEPHLIYYERDCLDQALAATRDALQRAERRLRSRRRSLGEDREVVTEGLVASSPEFRAVIELARRAARSDATVLVTGESGVGKERVSRLIHDESPRAAGPFLAVNCAAIAESVLDSELFGHAKGAFTGATRDRIGLFEAAQGGTLLLDEVGELPLSIQAKLLRVLQEREIRRLGENDPRPIDVRLIAATHRDLAAEAAAGRFRSDLLYRLNVIEVRVPPLRERPLGILPLSKLLIAELSDELGAKPKELSPEAAAALLAHPWPGNVRELRNALARALIVGQGRLLAVEHLPPDVRGALSSGRAAAPAPPERATGGPRTLAEVEREHILATLAASEGNRARAAADLGIGIATLYRKLKRYREDEAGPGPLD